MMTGTGRMMTSVDIIAEIEGDLALRVHDYVQATGTSPTLAMATNLYEGATEKYMTLKKHIGTELGFSVVEIVAPKHHDMRRVVDDLADTERVDGIIVQLPLADQEKTEEVLARLPAEKDVDGLGPHSLFEPATPLAIMKLIEAYAPEDKENMAIVGQGLLVGKPLARIALNRGFEVVTFDKSSDPEAMREGINQADIIVSATGVPGLLKPDMFDDMSNPKVLVDAGTTERSGSLFGDVSDELREAASDHDWLQTPHRGGVGPLTIRCLLKSTMTAAELRAGLVSPEA